MRFALVRFKHAFPGGGYPAIVKQDFPDDTTDEAALESLKATHENVTIEFFPNQEGRNAAFEKATTIQTTPQRVEPKHKGPGQ